MKLGALMVLLALSSLSISPAWSNMTQQAWADYAARAESMQPAAEFPFQHCFERAAATHQLPLTLLLAVARGESDFDPIARSDANAIGLMQIRWPQTGRHLGIRRLRDLYEPCTNVMAGAKYLAELLARYQGDIHLAIAAYNYGPSRVRANSVPTGAQWYSEYILRHLQFVSAGPLDTGEPVELAQSRVYRPAGKQVLISFNSPWRAQRLLAWLESVDVKARLAWFRAPLGRHELVLLYADEQERRAGLAALADIGLRVNGEQSIAM